MKSEKSLAQYSERYAEALSHLCAQSIINFGVWDYCVAIPLCGEGMEFWRFLKRLKQVHKGKCLVVACINSHSSTREDYRGINLELLKELRAYEGVEKISNENFTFLRMNTVDLLAIDCTTSGKDLPSKTGVGLARKVACDICFLLWQNQMIRSPMILCADADVQLPENYFDTDLWELQSDTSAMHFDFRHRCEPLAEKAVALELYEIKLRYYVAGLLYANSPYAYPAIGSCLGVAPEAYAKVRGFPSYEAGEDFYILNKLRKLGPVARPSTSPLEIFGRLGARIPFGTSVGTRKIWDALESGRDFQLYDPISFEFLHQLLTRFDELSRTGDWDGFYKFSKRQEIVRKFLEHLDYRRILVQFLQESKSTPQLKRKLMTWFDAFKSLKFIHHLRDEDFNDIPWDRALLQAPFIQSIKGASPSEYLENLRVSGTSHGSLSAHDQLV